MVRWQPGSRDRLWEAALQLYGERGFEQTTVAEIAERAGLTERTFFRYFADKREVFFSGQERIVEVVVDTLAATPPGVAALDAAAGALAATAEMFDDRRAGAAVRQDMLDAHPELRERELVKLARLADAIADGLRGRGETEPAARLAAETGVAVYRLAFGRWVRDGEPGRGLAEHVRDALAELRAVTAD